MSFTITVKNEMIRYDRIPSEKISELSALVRNNGIIGKTIKISTENAGVARLVYRMIKELYGIRPNITVRKGYNFHKSYIYINEIKRQKESFLKDIGLLENDLFQNIPPKYVIDDQELICAYIRGLFLSCGSINDPKTSRYHLEFAVDNEKYALFLSELLNRYMLNSKVIKRDTKYIIYVKEAEKIGDFLRIIRATKALLYYENIRIYRDHKNKTNRLNNCEQANVDKIIETASKQIRDIEYLKETNTFDLLDEKVKEAAEYRIKYQDTSLTELSEIITLETGTFITKSGLHHRLKKINTFAEKVRNQK